MPPPSNLREQLSAWLAANRALRCKVLEADAVLEAGSTGSLVVKMTAGKQQDLSFLRSAKTTPSPVSTFELRATAEDRPDRSWSGEAQRTLDDVAGSPRFKLPWGPVSAAGVYLVHLRLGGRAIEGSPVRVLVRPSGISPSASSIHRSDEQIVDHLPPGVLPPLRLLELSAGHEGSFVAAARDRFGNLRDEGGDTPYALLRRVASLPVTSDDGPLLYVPPPQGASDASGVPAVKIEVTDRGDGTYSVRFVRVEAGEYAASIWMSGVPVCGTLPVAVHPDQLCVRRCLASGQGLHQAVAAGGATFVITARDRCGNLVRLLPSDPLPWALRIEPRGDIDDETDEGEALAAAAAQAAEEMQLNLSVDGCCQVGYVMARAGRYLIHASHRAADGALTELPGSPYALSVLPSIDDPSCVVLDRHSGIEFARENEPAVLVAGQVTPRRGHRRAPPTPLSVLLLPSRRRPCLLSTHSCNPLPPPS